MICQLQILSVFFVSRDCLTVWLPWTTGMHLLTHTLPPPATHSLLRYNEKNYEHAILTFGDSGGGVAMMEFSKISYCMFGLASSTSKGLY